MPRGSRPGERRGGRQRGTPNKKTLLKNAVFLAAAAEPNRSPLDFMLALMRDPQVPLDDRIDIAAKAAPFVHARPAPVRTSDDLKFAKLEAKHAAANGGGGEGRVAGGGEGGVLGGGGDEGPGRSGEEGLSPLDFLLGVMADPAADSEQRVKAAAIAARYTHAVTVPDPEAPSIVVADKFGFQVAPELGRAERDDRLREATLGGASQVHKNGPIQAKVAEQEREQIGKRREERLARLSFPDGYTYADLQKDEKRLAQLSSKRASRKKLTAEEDAEEAHLAVRVLHPKVVKPKRVVIIQGDSEWPATTSAELNGRVVGGETLTATEETMRAVIIGGPFAIEWPATRIAELDERVVGGETLTATEEAERQELRRRHPDSAARADRLDHRYRYWLRKAKEIALKAGMEHSKALRAAEAKCKGLRDPTKINYADLPRALLKKIYDLETLRFDQILTATEANELEELHRLYPERAGRLRKLAERRLSDHERQRGYARERGLIPPPIEEDKWPRGRTPTGRMAGR
jgi:hypothetical protein